MRAYQNLAAAFLSEEKAATATEYAVMLALILVVIIASVTVLGQTLSSEYEDINTQLFPS